MIDAIIAIIITVIVLGIPLAGNGSLEAILDLRLEFLAYAVGFIFVFNVWKFSSKISDYIKKLDYKVIWTTGLLLFLLSFLPYLTTFAAMNFYDFVPQCLYGLLFIVRIILSFISAYHVQHIEEKVDFIEIYRFLISILIVSIGIIIGYLFYPPAVMMSCLFSVVTLHLINRKNKK